MPVYEYLCEACGKHQEHIRKFSDEPLTDCELCGAKGTLVKQISRSSFALKGSGWYTTDYKRAAKPGVAESEKPATSDAVPAASSEKSNPASAGDKPAAVGAAPSGTPNAVVSKPSGDKPAGDKPSGNKSASNKPSGSSKV